MRRSIKKLATCKHAVTAEDSITYLSQGCTTLAKNWKSVNSNSNLTASFQTLYSGFVWLHMLELLSPSDTSSSSEQSSNQPFRWVMLPVEAGKEQLSTVNPPKGATILEAQLKHHGSQRWGTLAGMLPNSSIWVNRREVGKNTWVSQQVQLLPT